MEVEHILRDFGLILGAGLLSQLIATVIKLPEMVVLVAAGALACQQRFGLAFSFWFRPRSAAHEESLWVAVGSYARGCAPRRLPDKVAKAKPKAPG